MKLIPMTDFVLEQNKAEEVTRESYIKCRDYANFLKKPLELWMFVPCDEDGNVLEEPKDDSYLGGRGSTDAMKLLQFKCKKDEYQQAKEKCLFEDFYVKKDDDGHLCLFHKNSEWYIAKIEPDFIWGRTNEFIIEDIIKFNPKLYLYKLNNKY